MIILIPFLIVTFLSLISIPNIKIKDRFKIELPENDSYFKKEASINSYFSTSDFILVSVETSELFTEKSLSILIRLTDSFKTLDNVSLVISAVSAKDMEVIDDELLFNPIYTGAGDKSLIELKKTINQTPIFSRFFLSRDKKAFNIYIIPQNKAKDTVLIPGILEIISKEINKNSAITDCRIFGSRVLNYYTYRDNLFDFIFLGIIALVVVFFIEIWITKSFLAGFVLWLVSMLPSLWTISLLPLFNFEFEAATMTVPVIVLALSTTYGIHLFRYFSADDKHCMTSALNKACPVVFFAGMTTVFGLGTLILSPINSIRIPGIMLVIGITSAVVTALFLLPRLLNNVSIKKENIFNIFNLWQQSNSKIYLISFFIITTLIAIGIVFIQSDYRSQTFYKKGTEVSKTIDYFYERNGGLNQIDIVIDTGAEYGLINTDTYNRIYNIVDKLRQLEDTSVIISFTDFVEWANGRMMGKDIPFAPVNDIVIGETIEILSSGNSGLGVDALIDAQYRRAKIQVRFGKRNVSVRQSNTMLYNLQSHITLSMAEYLPGVSYDIIGIPYINNRVLNYLLNGLSLSFVLFYPVLFILLFIVFKSIKWAIAAIIPSVCSVLFYFGVMGWLGLSLNVVTAVMTATVMGVSNDDVICFILFLRQRLKETDLNTALKTAVKESGSAIVQTTIVIVGGMSILLLSRYTRMSESSLLCVTSFIFSTAVTCFIVPVILYKMLSKKRIT